MQKRIAPSALAARLTCLLAVSSPLAAQWQELVVGATPSVRGQHAMAYDSQRDRVVMFGGLGTSVLADTWEWDGQTWTQIATSGPSQRSGHAMVFDSQRGVCVLFGGFSSSATGDTWEWDGQTWTQVASSGPAPRYYHAMAYDSQRGRTVLYGGASPQAPAGFRHDTWEWDGTTWMLRSTGGTTTEPQALSKHAMSYDSARGRTVMFGGNTSVSGPASNTWEWDGTQWTLASTSGPSGRSGHAMAFEAVSNKTMLFGGASSGLMGDTWAWDGSNWSPAASSGPSPRIDTRMAASGQGTITLFGGRSGGVLGDTWEWSNETSFLTFGAGCDASPATLEFGQNTAGGNLNINLAPVEFGILLPITQQTTITHFDIYTCSTGGDQTVLAHIYRLPNNQSYGCTPITIGANAGFYSATFATPVDLSPGAYMIAVDATAQNIVLPALTNGTTGFAGTRLPGHSWNFVAAPVGWRAYTVQPVSLGHVGLPKLGTSYDLTLSGALANEMAVLMTGFSKTSFAGINLPFVLPTTQSCSVYVAPQFNHQTVTSSTGEASCTIAVPSSTVHLGTTLYHQWLVFDPINPLGLITSNAGEAFVWF